MPKNLIFLGFFLLQSKLYHNSYLAMLNARDDLRERADRTMSLHFSRLSGMQGRSGDTTTTQDTLPEKMMAIKVNTYIEHNEDSTCGPSNSTCVNPVPLPGLHV